MKGRKGEREPPRPRARVAIDPACCDHPHTGRLASVSTGFGPRLVAPLAVELDKGAANSEDVLVVKELRETAVSTDHG